MRWRPAVLIDGEPSGSVWRPSSCPAVEARQGQEGGAGPDAGHGRLAGRPGTPAWRHCGGRSQRRGDGGQARACFQVYERCPHAPGSTCTGGMLMRCPWLLSLSPLSSGPLFVLFQASLPGRLTAHALAAWAAWPRCWMPSQTTASSCPRQVCSIAWVSASSTACSTSVGKDEPARPGPSSVHTEPTIHASKPVQTQGSFPQAFGPLPCTPRLAPSRWTWARWHPT